MQTAFQHCAALVREADRDRYLATLFAPSKHREALLALYAFNVEIARVRDLAREPMPGEIRLQWWREVLGGERQSEARAHPVAAALRETLMRYKLAASLLVGLIDARTFDLYDEPMATLADLQRYGAQTDAAVFTMAGQILGAAADALTREAGLAFAIAGTLSGFAKHTARRQLYVPLDVLERHGVERESIFAGEFGEPLQAALAELRELARQHLAAAETARAAAPPAILPALLPVALVGPALRRHDDPLRPDPLPAWRRQWILWRAARDPRRIFRA
jgi:15-cis-phytoene synthase